MTAARFLASLTLILLVGCATPGAPGATTPVGGAASTGTQAPAPPAARSAEKPGPAVGDASDHYVAAIQGQLAIKRSTWSQFLPATTFAIVRVGDLLKIEGPSQVKIACSDLSLQLVRAGTSGVPCQVAKPLLSFQSSAIRATRSDAGAGFPTVVAPRKTNVLSERPVIRWTPVQGATTYKVTVRGPGVNWSADVVGKTETTYPDSAAALHPGEAYKVTIVAATPAGNRSSDEEQLADLGFIPLKPEQRQAVRDASGRIERLDLEADQKRFLLGRLYAAAENGLYSEAIEQLEELAKTLKAPAVARVLGEWYQAVYLNRLAEQRFLQALELAQQANDAEGQALALDALGQQYRTLGNPAEAATRTEAAAGIYQTLGDAKKADEMKKRLADLSQR